MGVIRKLKVKTADNEFDTKDIGALATNVKVVKTITNEDNERVESISNALEEFNNLDLRLIETNTNLNTTNDRITVLELQNDNIYDNMDSLMRTKLSLKTIIDSTVTSLDDNVEVLDNSDNGMTNRNIDFVGFVLKCNETLSPMILSPSITKFAHFNLTDIDSTTLIKTDIIGDIVLNIEGYDFETTYTVVFDKLKYVVTDLNTNITDVYDEELNKISSNRPESETPEEEEEQSLNIDIPTIEIYKVYLFTHN